MSSPVTETFNISSLKGTDHSYAGAAPSLAPEVTEQEEEERILKEVGELCSVPLSPASAQLEISLGSLEDPDIICTSDIPGHSSEVSSWQPGQPASPVAGPSRSQDLYTPRRSREHQWFPQTSSTPRDTCAGCAKLTAIVGELGVRVAALERAQTGVEELERSLALVGQGGEEARPRTPEQAGRKGEKELCRSVEKGRHTAAMSPRMRASLIGECCKSKHGSSNIPHGRVGRCGQGTGSIGFCCSCCFLNRRVFEERSKTNVNQISPCRPAPHLLPLVLNRESSVTEGP